MDIFRELWELAKTAGPFGSVLLFFLWYRREIQCTDLQKRYDALLERTLNALNNSSNSFTELRTFVTGVMQDRSTALADLRQFITDQMHERRGK